jgi:murein L,D-transpeptidase YafK
LTADGETKMKNEEYFKYWNSYEFSDYDQFVSEYSNEVDEYGN